MTLEKAIQDIELILKPGNAYLAADKPEALHLSIEALDALHRHRKVWGYSEFELLPGETKED